MPAAHRKLRVATCQFAEGFGIGRNAAMIRRYMSAAKKRRATIVHFHEACLSGYLALKDAPSAKQINWPALRAATEDICRQAARLKLWVVLGSAHPLTPPHRPTNCLYLISPEGEIVDRYDKRFCTAGDLKVYTPGSHFVTFTINRIRCGLLICFDLRFPEIYRELYKMGVRLVFQSFHNGHMDSPGIHRYIMRQTLQANAGANAMWISAPNSSAHYSRWPSVFITPDGKITGQLTRGRAGVMVNTVDPAQDFYDPTKPFRRLAIAGKLHTGRCVRDARLKDRRSL